MGQTDGETDGPQHCFMSSYRRAGHNDSRPGAEKDEKNGRYMSFCQDNAEKCPYLGVTKNIS